MNVYELPISKINPAKYNPRKITDQEFAGLKESLKKFGFVEPLIVNKKTNTLVGGHMRLRAAEQLNYQNVPVAYVDLSEAEEKALNVALNSHTISGKFDLEILPTLLEEINIELPDLNLNFDQLEKDLGLKFQSTDEDEDKKKDLRYLLEIELSNADELREKYDQLISEGLIVKVKT